MTGNSIKSAHLWMLAGGVVAVGGLVYHFIQKNKESLVDKKKKRQQLKKNPEEFTAEDVMMVLMDVSTAQHKMKGVLQELTKEITEKKLNFQETHDRVKEVQPDDPLERHGLTMQQFDEILDRTYADPAVATAVSAIMCPSPNVSISEKVKTVEKDMVVEIHKFMLEELENIVAEYKKLDKRKFDYKSTTIAAQAIVSAKVEEKYGVTSDDIEGAVLFSHEELAADEDFTGINSKMQRAMHEFM